MEPIHLFVPTFRVEEVLAEIRECPKKRCISLALHLRLTEADVNRASATPRRVASTGER